MLNNMHSLPLLIRNNIISIVAHSCICFISLPFFLLIRNKLIPSMSSDLIFLLYDSIVAAISIIIFIFLYFWVGRKFLTSTHNILTDGLSVIGLLILLIICAIAYFICEAYVIMMFLMPIGLISGAIAHLLHVNAMYVCFIMSILPSLCMWTGMILKNKA